MCLCLAVGIHVQMYHTLTVQAMQGRELRGLSLGVLLANFDRSHPW